MISTRKNSRQQVDNAFDIYKFCNEKEKRIAKWKKKLLVDFKIKCIFFYYFCLVN